MTRELALKAFLQSKRSGFSCFFHTHKLFHLIDRNTLTHNNLNYTFKTSQMDSSEQHLFTFEQKHWSRLIY